MRKVVLYIIFVSFIGLYGCKSSKPDFETEISDMEIYDFMKFVVSDLKIPDSASIQQKPTILFYRESGVKGFEISQFTKRTSDQRDGIIKPSDTTFILNQNNRILNGFNWNLEKLGYEQNKNSMSFTFSLPYFTRNRQEVIVLVTKENTSAFMAGSSELLYYEKNNERWEKRILKSILN